MEYVFANGSSGFKLWREKGGDGRILSASGLSSDGWQKTLNRSGVGFSSNDLTDATVISQIAGRVCPTHVFLDYDNMTATGRCLYYDSSNTSQGLSDWNGNEAEDWLSRWDRSATGRGASSSYYEGNINPCADKGMRLPTIYETTMSKPSNYLPTGDGLASDPTWAGSTNGVPNVGNTWTWTASAHTGNTSIADSYWMWVGASGTNHYYDRSHAIRCVLP
jgi:hypothetical protein